MSISINVGASSAIPDLTALKEWIADEVDRDLSEISDRLDKYITLTEAHFNRHLRARQMERSVLGHASTEDTTLPDDYLAMRVLYEEGSPDRPLRAISPSAMRQTFDGSSGIPVAYALVSGGIRLVPPPASAVALSMDYWARIEPLTVLSPTNWVLDEHPDLYVYGTLFHFYRWSGNREAALDAKALRDELIAELNRLASSDRYGAGPLVPTTVAQVRGSRC